jgi:hypothetical protein
MDDDIITENEEPVVITGKRSNLPDYKIRLSGPGGDVVFEASAPLSESRQAGYEGYGIIHLPTALVSYKQTSSRTFAITGKLISRTTDEATQNARNLDLIRRWILPDFGGTGATPPILTIYGYRNDNIDGRRVVLRQYGWNFPEEVDYIFTGEQPMPIIGQLDVTVEEVYSAAEVTAGAWRLSLGGEGEFSKSQNESSSSFELTGNGYGRTDPLRTSLPSASNITSVMSALGGGKVTVPGVIAGTIARTLGTAALNSPAVRAITNSLPPVLKNIFVSGANVAVSEVGKTVTKSVSTVTQPSSTSAFGRDTPLVPPGPVGD